MRNERTARDPRRLGSDALKWFIRGRNLPAEPTREQLEFFVEHLQRVCPNALQSPECYAVVRLTADEVARILQTDLAEVRRLAESRRVPTERIPGGLIYFEAGPIWRRCWNSWTPLKARKPALAKPVNGDSGSTGHFIPFLTGLQLLAGLLSEDAFRRCVRERLSGEKNSREVLGKRDSRGALLVSAPQLHKLRRDLLAGREQW